MATENNSKKIKFSYSVDDFVDKLSCPLSKLIFKNPVTPGDDHVYEKSEIIRWYISKNDSFFTSPLTREKFKSFKLYPCQYIKNDVIDFLDKYPEYKDDQFSDFIDFSSNKLFIFNNLLKSNYDFFDVFNNFDLLSYFRSHRLIDYIVDIKNNSKIVKHFLLNSSNFNSNIDSANLNYIITKLFTGNVSSSLLIDFINKYHINILDLDIDFIDLLFTHSCPFEKEKISFLIDNKIFMNSSHVVKFFNFFFSDSLISTYQNFIFHSLSLISDYSFFNNITLEQFILFFRYLSKDNFHSFLKYFNFKLYYQFKKDVLNCDTFDDLLDILSNTQDLFSSLKDVKSITDNNTLHFNDKHLFINHLFEHKKKVADFFDHLIVCYCLVDTDNDNLLDDDHIDGILSQLYDFLF